MKRLLMIFILVAITGIATAADELRVENKAYGFAFTFEPGTELSYEADGVGIAGSHVPARAKRSDYGILVYGSPAMSLSAAEAKAAKLGTEDMLLNAADVTDADKWAEAFTAIMEARAATQAGAATVKSGAATVTIPYYTWEQSVLGRTHHALMYVVKHGDAFIYVQVESNKALPKTQQAWMASKLELLP
jgi:hypothetical protein